LAREALKTRR